jgi:nucleotide-binding universal stress UspA family protein
MLSIQTILHPTDYSEYSEYAFRLSCSLARDYGAHLVLLHVITGPRLIGGEDPVACKIIDEFLDQQQQKLEGLRPADPKLKVTRQLAQGDPALEILRVAREINCDMIVMGTHGLTGVKRLLMGSVAEGVTREARCPVVIVRTPFPRGEMPFGSPVGKAEEAHHSAVREENT